MRYYSDPAEQAAYNMGREEALMGLPHLAHRDWPNAYSAGYWDHHRDGTTRALVLVITKVWDKARAALGRLGGKR